MQTTRNTECLTLYHGTGFIVTILSWILGTDIRSYRRINFLEGQRVFSTIDNEHTIQHPEKSLVNQEIQLQSRLTCPNCGHEETETMPTDACQWYYECKACGTLLRPKKGDCCVFCSYGSVACPPVQQGEGCCDTS